MGIVKKELGFCYMEWLLKLLDYYRNRRIVSVVSLSQQKFWGYVV